MMFEIVLEESGFRICDNHGQNHIEDHDFAGIQDFVVACQLHQQLNGEFDGE